MMMGESYLGKKVLDVLALCSVLRSKKYSKIHLYGSGLGSVTAALAALLDPSVATVTLYNAPLSWRENIDSVISRWPVSHLPANVLHHFDLPDVYALLAKKKLSIIDPWNARMEVYAKDECEREAKMYGVRVPLQVNEPANT
jgi:pimeloyl-ACP methyl ester carboxylesterase